MSRERYVCCWDVNKLYNLLTYMEIEFEEKVKMFEEQQDTRDNGMSPADSPFTDAPTLLIQENVRKEAIGAFRQLMSGIDRARDLPKTVRHDREECQEEVKTLSASVRSKTRWSQKHVRTIEANTATAASAPAVAAKDRAQEKLEVRSAQDQTIDVVIAQDEAMARMADT